MYWIILTYGFLLSFPQTTVITWNLRWLISGCDTWTNTFLLPQGAHIRMRCCSSVTLSDSFDKQAGKRYLKYVRDGSGWFQVFFHASPWTFGCLRPTHSWLQILNDWPTTGFLKGKFYIYFASSLQKKPKQRQKSSSSDGTSPSFPVQLVCHHKVSKNSPNTLPLC